ncbi:MAG TPA: hypothetical protein VFQ53_23260 [Kofleriaceae bacterium]|nr:hypothetical protein [Kofleriaceae bacterium]
MVELPTGFHLVQALAGLIDGDQPWLTPGLVVVDAIARGCAGTTIARGLRELGLAIPTVLITREQTPLLDREQLAAHPEIAARVVAEVARPWSPAKHLDPPAYQERAIA